MAAELWSATSYKALREEALEVDRHNRLHPSEPPRAPYVTEALANAEGPIVAVTDYMKAVPDQIARWAPGPFITLGTDGFGRSDTRQALRRHFETDAAHVVVAALDGLRQAGEGKAEEVEDAIRRYGIDPGLQPGQPEPTGLRPAGDDFDVLIWQATPRPTSSSPRTPSRCSSAWSSTSRSRWSEPSALPGTCGTASVASSTREPSQRWSPTELAAVFSQRPALHRFPASNAGRVQQLCQIIVSDYGGDAARVWEGASSRDRAAPPCAGLTRVWRAESQDFRRAARQAARGAPVWLAGGQQTL